MKSSLSVATIFGLYLLASPPFPAYASDPNVLETSDRGSQEPAKNTSANTLRNDLQVKRAATEQELAQINSPQTLRTGAPDGVPESELHERRSLLQQLVNIYDRHLDELGKIDQTRQRLQEVEQSAKEWTGFSTPPPYSILMLDDVRDTLRSLTVNLEGMQSRNTMIEHLEETAHAVLKQSEGQSRQAAERLEGTHDPAEVEKLTWTKNLWQLRTRVAAARSAMLETSQKQLHDEMAEVRQRIALVERQERAAQQEVQFTDQDYERIKKRLDGDHQAVEDEIERALLEQPLRRRDIEKAEALLAAAQTSARTKGTRTKQSRGSLTKLTESVDLKRLQSDNLNLHIDLLRHLLDDIEQEQRIWELRFAAARQRLAPSEEREAQKKLVSTLQQIKGRREYGFQQLAMTAAEISELEDRVAQATSSFQGAHLGEMLRAFRHREGLYRRIVQRDDGLLRLIAYRQDEFERLNHERPWSARLQDWGMSAMTTLRRAWNIELFAAEDTIEVDGQSITGRRSVTIGKVMKALAILLVGYWISRALARLAQRVAVTRFQMDPDVANIVRQWTLAFLFTILLIITLISVKIPLAAFAFLGGALAIGVGFGTQNLLKNLISGMLLLIEQPLRVGDEIEVDGIRGMVTTIGLRSSTIRERNGVETLIPNSHLLERNLTNWTYSSYRKRYALRVAVAAGTATRQVRDLLIEVAGQHGKVLKDPGPSILLEEFADSTLVFSLQYWIEIGPAVEPATIASDLRFMIERTFAEAGIVRK
ncbi:MAG: mechanosensitive ion channel domain-containing protein [Nitrospiraceae bacterium]